MAQYVLIFFTFIQHAIWNSVESFEKSLQDSGCWKYSVYRKQIVASAITKHYQVGVSPFESQQLIFHGVSRHKFHV